MRQEIRFGWWNTHLTPPGGSTASGNDRSLALCVIRNLLAAGVELLFLGEVSQYDMDWLDRQLIDSMVSFKTASFESTSSSRHKFNLGVIFADSDIAISDHEYVTGIYDDTVHKAGLRLTCEIGTDLSMDVFVAHWASRLTYGEESTAREKFGEILRGAVDSRLSAGRHDIIVLGDFNDEPFNRSMTIGLRSTRELEWTPFYRTVGGWV